MSQNTTASSDAKLTIATTLRKYIELMKECCKTGEMVPQDVIIGLSRELGVIVTYFETEAKQNEETRS